MVIIVTMKKNAKYWIDKFKLLPHPEGGHFSETYRSAFLLDLNWGQRSAITSIFYLLEGSQFSGFHRIKSPELWYYHAGSTLMIYEITVAGILHTHLLNSENPFAAIAPNSWFSSEVEKHDGFVLVSCAVAPRFDFHDFEMAKQRELINLSSA